MINRKMVAALAITILSGSCVMASAQNESWKRISAHGKHSNSKHRSTVPVPPDSSRSAKSLNQQVDRIEKQTHRARVTTKDGSRAAASYHHKPLTEKSEKNPSMNFQSQRSHSVPRGHKSASSRSKVGSVGLKR